uniref:Sterol carrier protein 2 n=1 Tax=Macrostomum lignano TaxID=282301 RepID=A0A1I8HAI5_9PLAT
VLAERHGLEAAPIAAQMFGAAGREHMKMYGTTPEHFAKIAAKNHRHSANNPNSQFTDVYSLAADLRAPDQAAVLPDLDDGAAAAVLASEEFVLRYGLQAQAVELLAVEMATDLPSVFNDKSAIKMVGYDMTSGLLRPSTRKTGRDQTNSRWLSCTTASLLTSCSPTRRWGSCPTPGKAGELVDRGDNTYGGKFVVNPSGGLISKGHPLGATGLAQCTELCWQLRGLAGPRQVPGCRRALQHNIGLGGAVVVAAYQLGFPEAAVTAASVAGVSAGDSQDEFQSAKIFRIIGQGLETEGEQIVKRRCERCVTGGPGGKVGLWLVDCKNGRGKVEFNGQGKADVTITISDQDLVQLMLGKLNPQQAFFSGKLKMQGNMGLAMKLREFQSRVGELKAKLKAEVQPELHCLQSPFKALPKACIRYCFNDGVCAQCTGSGLNAVCNRCSCLAPFVGQRCESRGSALLAGGRGDAWHREVAVAVLLLTGLALLLLLGGLLLAWHRHRKQRWQQLDSVTFQHRIFHNEELPGKTEQLSAASTRTFCHCTWPATLITDRSASPLLHFIDFLNLHPQLHFLSCQICLSEAPPSLLGRGFLPKPPKCLARRGTQPVRLSWDSKMTVVLMPLRALLIPNPMQQMVRVRPQQRLLVGCATAAKWLGAMYSQQTAKKEMPQLKSLPRSALGLALLLVICCCCCSLQGALAQDSEVERICGRNPFIQMKHLAEKIMRRTMTDATSITADIRAEPRAPRTSSSNHRESADEFNALFSRALGDPHKGPRLRVMVTRYQDCRLSVENGHF